MQTFPLENPGEPDSRSAGWYLWWLATKQWQVVILGATWGIIWMLSLAFMPEVIGRAIDTGIAQRDDAALVRWGLIALGLSVLAAVAGIFRHRNAMANIYASEFRTVQVAARHAAELGSALPKRIASGDIVAIGGADMAAISAGFQNLPITVGSLAAVVAVAALMLQASVSIGIIVLLGVPLMMIMTALLTRPLRSRQAQHRGLQAQLATQATDIAAGLRVLRSVGGSREFLVRFRATSSSARDAGVRIAKVEALFAAMEIILPGVLTVLVTWVSARSALHGDVSVGQVVAFYAYAAFLAMPLSIFVGAVNSMTGAYVSAGRVASFLRLEPNVALPESSAGRTDVCSGSLRDALSGVEASPGGTTAVVCRTTSDAEFLAERLAGYGDCSSVTWNNTPLNNIPHRNVRELIILLRSSDYLFGGQLRDVLASGSAKPSDEQLVSALHVASAEDVLAEFDGGLDTACENGLTRLSGGQQQRLRLARAVAAEPECLIMLEPTHSVDAHTEARIAQRLINDRAGLVTIVLANSPLWLTQCQDVFFVENGRVVARGHHSELLKTCPSYSDFVSRKVAPSA